MIFSCGENYKSRRERLSDWHDFFPLFPRTVAVEDGKDICAWLQTIQRKGRYLGWYEGDIWVWEYRRK